MAACTTVGVDYSRLKLLCILEGPGAAVLFRALKWGTNKTTSVNILEYLNCLPDSSTANYCKLNSKQKRNQFTSSDKIQIEKDPSYQSFDITLLFKCIKLACEDVAGLSDARWQDDTTMEGLLFKIKEERNSCVHERPQMTDEQFKGKVEEFKGLFIRALQAVKDKYRVSDTETTKVIDNITTQIQYILQAFTDEFILQMNFDKRLLLFKEVSVGHLRNTYEDFQYFDPLFFLSASQEERVNIQTVFSELVLEEQSKYVDIESLELLKVLSAEFQSRQSASPSQPVQTQRPRLAVVSGIAGSGKTTLLTFILSEWLKEECDRRVTHLDEYDIVLRILCRDTDAEDLETFLGLVLPSSLLVFSEPLVTFLKHCKVLFLIDGLDEMNSTSERLINNILNITKYKRNFSILASSRPERVEQFLALTRQHYKQSHISIKGIPVNRRMDFALQYSTSTNQDRLKEFITEQGDLTLFELPINLIFLVTLFEDSPHFNTTKMTQSSLYTRIHEWCIEKLHYRISVRPTWGNNEPETLKTRMKKVLKEVYHMALQGLLQDRLSLSDGDTKRIVDCCKRENLPSYEFLGAFFTQRSTITNRIVKKNYFAPHKGLLEYFAARHIMQRLQERSLTGPMKIMTLLQNAVQSQTHSLLIRNLCNIFIRVAGRLPQGAAQPQSPDFRSLRNFFLHVAGLLATEEVPNHSEIIKEVINLVGRTGAEWKEWMALVEDTDYEERFLQGIALHITQNPPDDTAEIRDNTLASAAALLPLTPTRRVDLWLANERVNVENVRAFIHHHCRNLTLEHHYQHPGNIPASNMVLHAVDRSHLRVFVGQLSVDGVALLPAGLESLGLAVWGDEQAARLPTALTRARAASSLSRLLWLDIHVPMATLTPAAAPSPLPDISTWRDRGVGLVLSGVDSCLLEEACRVAAALQPITGPGYEVIGFPWGRMEAAEWVRLLKLLKATQVRLRLGVVIPEASITEEERRNLNRLTKNLWECEVERLPDKQCFLSQIPEDSGEDES